MDTLKTTVREDALGKDVKHPASSGACEMNSTEKPDKETSFHTENVKKATQEETDDLLEKIEEVVKDKVSSESLENDISQSSEHDFIKKIEEIENEVQDALHDGDLSKDKECESEKVVVGKLVLEVSSDEKPATAAAATAAADSNGENDLNALTGSCSGEVSEAKKDEKKTPEDVKDKGKNSVGESKASKDDACNEAEANGRKDDINTQKSKEIAGSKVEEDAGVKEVSASGISNTVPQAPSVSPEKLVKTKDQKKIDEHIPSEKSPAKSSEKAIEEVSSTSPEVPIEAKESKSLEKEVAKVSEIIPAAEPEKKEEPMSVEAEKKEEPMAVDLCDPLMEPMDVDSEEKMDVDLEAADDVCEVIDEEMAAVDQEARKLDVDISVNEAEALKPAQSTQAPTQAKVSNTDNKKDVDKSSAKESKPIKPTADVETKKEEKKKQEKTPEKTEKPRVETVVNPVKSPLKDSKKLPANESPVSSTTIDSLEVNTGKKSAAAAVELKKKIEQKTEPGKAVSTSVTSAVVKKPSGSKSEQAAACAVDGAVSTTKTTEEDVKKSKELPRGEKGSKDTRAEPEKKIKEKVATAKEIENIEIISIDSEESREATEVPEKKATVTSVKGKNEEKKKKDSEDVIIVVEDEKPDDETEKGSKSDSKKKSVPEIAKVTKDIPTSSQKAIVVEVKDHHSSDSTASLSSTVDEHIIKFSMDTTIPLEPEQPLKKIENKPLLNMMKHGGSTSSLDTTPVLASNVFNSTPIQKQFEISSENVSKISHGIETSRSEKAVDDDANLNKSCKPEYSTESGTTCTTTSHQSSTEQHSSDNPESGHQTSDGIAKYIKVIKKYNGITDSTTDDEEIISNVKSSLSQIGSDVKADSLYEINTWFDKTELAFLSVQKVDLKKISSVLLEGSEQASSSNGSVTSLPPFNLPSSRLSEVSISSGGTQNTPPDGKATSYQIKKSKFKIQGISQLCNFMIDEFTKIKKSLQPEELKVDIPQETKDTEEPTTPKSQNKEPAKKNLAKGKSASPAVSDLSPSPHRAEKRSRKRSFNKSPSQEDDEGKSKAKQPRKSQATKSHGTPSKEIESLHSELAGQCVLAKWVDKKYYAGKISGEKPGNKFVVLFEDGASKVLPKESIVFGEGETLPLKDCSVHALVDDDFECGVVLSIDEVDNKIIYTVKAETKTVKVTASDLYLQDDQAKAIQNAQNAQKKGSTSASPEESSAGSGSRATRNKRASTSPVTPEPGFSGGVKKGAKRQKRMPSTKLNRISESSDVTDTPEPLSTAPESLLEGVEGVQPELQKTEKEAELSKKIFIADYLDFEPTCNPQEMLGKLPTSKTLFKNKYFLLTCSVGLKPHRFIENDSANQKNRQFSKIPFVKNYLQKQIQEGGGTVYNHFEEIPRSKYRHCKLIAPRPCTTAKYIQCLTVDIQAISHEWIIDSCNKNSLQDHKKYILPSGWSILAEKFIRWPVGRASDQRESNQPFNRATILIASEHKDFVTFWSRVCKAAGATVRFIKYIEDITQSTQGYMVTDRDFPQIIRSKASHFGIPVVTTVWIVQSLIMGSICPPNSSAKLTRM